MESSYRAGRRRISVWILATVFAALVIVLGLARAAVGPEKVFVGFITDTECGPDHRPMLAKGDMGKNDHECTLACVTKGATFGFVDEASRKFYQLDDQQAPVPFAGTKVRLEGRVEGDTILVTSIAAADGSQVSSLSFVGGRFCPTDYLLPTTNSPGCHHDMMRST